MLYQRLDFNTLFKYALIPVLLFMYPIYRGSTAVWSLSIIYTMRRSKDVVCRILNTSGGIVDSSYLGYLSSQEIEIAVICTLAYYGSIGISPHTACVSTTSLESKVFIGTEKKKPESWIRR